MLLTRKIPLSNARKGDVFKFHYLQPLDGEHSQVGRVVNVRDTKENPVRLSTLANYRWMDRRSGIFKRSRYLVTLQTAEGFRNFYAENRTVSARRYTAFGRLILKLLRKV